MASVSPAEYRAVVNAEEQYSVQPSYLPVPPGWRDAGFSGSEEACLAFVGERWTDARPASLRMAGEDIPGEDSSA
jgi:MbtH protein